jgi:hypothetical protein
MRHKWSYSRIVAATTFVGVFALCPGCWKKIEYTGSDSSADKAPSPPPVATDNTAPPKQAGVTSPQNEQAAAAVSDVRDTTQATVVQPDSAPPVSTAATTTPPKSDDAASGKRTELTPPQSGLTGPAVLEGRDTKLATVPQPVSAPPLSASATARSPNTDDDRYATPPKVDTQTFSPSSPPATKTPLPAVEQPQPPPQPAPQAAPRHTDATPTSATVKVAPRTSSPNTRRAAWVVGSRLSLAALANDRGLAPKNVSVWFNEARAEAKTLGISLPELPDPSAAGEDTTASQQVIDFLLVQYQRLSRELSQKHGPEHAALFEVALKSNVLILLYGPGSNTTKSISAAISTAAPQARLPAQLWKPLVELLGKQSSLADVRSAVQQMHNDVERYLATAAEQGGR